MSEEFFFICGKGKLNRIRFAEIVYMEFVNESLTIQLKNQQRIFTEFTMSRMLDQLSSETFIRVNATSIVAIASVQMIEANYLIAEGIKIPLEKIYAISATNAFRKNIEKQFNELILAYTGRRTLRIVSN